MTTPMNNNQFPFYTAPKEETMSIGSKEYGMIQLPKLKDITVFEKTYVEQALDNETSATVMIAELINLLIQEEELTPEEARAVVMGSEYEMDDDEATEIRKRYLQELTQLNQDISDFAQKRKIASAEAMIIGRLKQNDIKAVKELVGSMSMSLIDDINEFWLNEVSGWETPEEAAGK